ncbi:MAG: hypothetical protein AB7E04_03560, partial [Desulfobacteraceae bacterium]
GLKYLQARVKYVIQGVISFRTDLLVLSCFVQYLYLFLLPVFPLCFLSRFEAPGLGLLVPKLLFGNATN